MKKIRLNVADLNSTEVLSRNQLKSIMGGSGNGSGSGLYPNNCKSSACTMTWFNEDGTVSGMSDGFCTGETVYNTTTCWCNATGVTKATALLNSDGVSHCTAGH